MCARRGKLRHCETAAPRRLAAGVMCRWAGGRGGDCENVIARLWKGEDDQMAWDQTGCWRGCSQTSQFVGVREIQGTIVRQCQQRLRLCEAAAPLERLVPLEASLCGVGAEWVRSGSGGWVQRRGHCGRGVQRIHLRVIITMHVIGRTQVGGWVECSTRFLGVPRRGYKGRSAWCRFWTVGGRVHAGLPAHHMVYARRPALG